MSYNTTGSCQKVHEGRKSMLAEILSKLKAYILNHCEKGVQLTNRMVLREASQLLPAFKDKSQQSKELALQHFTRSAGLTQRSAMLMAQKYLLETEADTKDFMAMTRDKVDGRNPDDIIDMDQILIAFSHHSNKMLDVKGTKTIHTRMSMSGMKLVTLVATVTTRWNMLPAYHIFKG